jgi:hypothetical protein
MNKIEQITERVNRNGNPDDPSTPIPLLTLEAFFEGNDIDGSICCNLEPCPSPKEVFEALKTIRSKTEVADILVQITAFDDPDWPFSDTVWVITSADSETVRSWLPKSIEPNECWEGWVESQTYEEYKLPAGMNPIACWWD